MVLLWYSRSKAILRVLMEVKEASKKDRWMRKEYMGAERVGLREMVMTMKRLAKTMNRKMNSKAMKGILCKCGFCVSPRRTNSVTLLGRLKKSI